MLVPPGYAGVVIAFNDGTALQAPGGELLGLGVVFTPMQAAFAGSGGLSARMTIIPGPRIIGPPGYRPLNVSYARRIKSLR